MMMSKSTRDVGLDACAREPWVEIVEDDAVDDDVDVSGVGVRVFRAGAGSARTGGGGDARRFIVVRRHAVGIRGRRAASAGESTGIGSRVHGARGGGDERERDSGGQNLVHRWRSRDRRSRWTHGGEYSGGVGKRRAHEAVPRTWSERVDIVARRFHAVATRGV